MAAEPEIVERPSMSERMMQALLDIVTAPEPTEDELDAASARRVTLALRREQAARDGRPLAQAWGQLADRVERRCPTP